MKVFLAFALTLFAGLVHGDHPAPYNNQYDVPAQYAFKWEVKDDYSQQDFGQEEARSGYNTDGEYFVLLPDGRKQITTYKVADSESGYVAEVRYEGEPREYVPTKPYSPPVTYKPAPATYKPTPAPYIPSPYTPSPSYKRPVYTPAPIKYTPAPIKYTPAPIQYTPAPVQYTPAPIKYTPAPIKYTPAPIRYSTTTTTAAPLKSSPVFDPSKVEKKRMRLTPKLKVSPSKLNLGGAHLFYGDLHKEKFKNKTNKKTRN